MPIRAIRGQSLKAWGVWYQVALVRLAPVCLAGIAIPLAQEEGFEALLCPRQVMHRVRPRSRQVPHRRVRHVHRGQLFASPPAWRAPARLTPSLPLRGCAISALPRFVAGAAFVGHRDRDRIFVDIQAHVVLRRFHALVSFQVVMGLSLSLADRPRLPGQPASLGTSALFFRAAYPQL